jgi:hypothetical protein
MDFQITKSKEGTHATQNPMEKRDCSYESFQQRQNYEIH